MLLYKTKWDWEQDMAPEKIVKLHKLMLVGELYLWQDEAPVVPGPTKVFQFKIKENMPVHTPAHMHHKFSLALPVSEVCKFGSQNRESTLALIELLRQRVLTLQDTALRSQGSGGGKYGSQQRYGSSSSYRDAGSNRNLPTDNSSGGRYGGNSSGGGGGYVHEY